MLKRIFYLKLLMGLLLMAFAVPHAQADELIVANGTVQNNYVPVFGNNDINGRYTEIIYPSTLLQGMVNSEITSIKFYCQSKLYLYNKKYTVEVGETTQESFGSAITSGLTEVATNVNLAANISEFNIDFTTPFTYRGGNLVIKLTQTAAGSSDKSVFYGITQTGASYTSWSQGNTYVQNFMPKISFTFNKVSYIVTPENGTLAFGEVSTTGSKTLNITIQNNSGSGVTPTLGSLSAPFSTSYVASEIADGETATIPIRFAPTAGTSYSGTFTITLNGVDYTFNMTGSGRVNEPTMDDDYFAALTYDWTDHDGVLHKGTPMNEVATSAEQIVALLKAVYTNKAVPGNIYRGFTADGAREADMVSYPAIGSVSSGSFTDSYGWGFNTANIVTVGSTSYADPTEYIPNEEGLTVILVEMNDQTVAEAKATEYGLPTTISGSSDYQSTSGYTDLVQKFDVMFKSARVLTSSKNLGGGNDAGTLFKIDCDKMNRFFLLAKGHLRTPNDVNNTYYANGKSYQVVKNSSIHMGPFYEMFEQFSPNVAASSSSAQTDIYQKMVNMEAYGVLHDCVSIPSVGGHHEFNLYGVASTSDDCQDVRDMMFFIPERRMTYWYDSENHSVDYGFRDPRDHDYEHPGVIIPTDEKYMNYHPDMQPRVGLFVIKQFPITGNQIDNQNTYKLHLTWTSNLLDFLPGEDGKYSLYRVVIIDGVKQYVKVADDLDPNTFEYDDYVPMLQHGQTVTYVVRGQDEEEFLTLQYSNEESFIIPGLNHAEQLQLKLTNEGFYSRFDPQTHSNYYSNRLTIENSVGTNVKASYLENGSVLELYRIPNLASYSAGLDADITLTQEERDELRTEYILEHRINFANATVSNMNTTGSGTGTLTIAPVTTAPNYWDGSVYSVKGEYVASPTTGSFTYDHDANSVVFTNFVVHDNMCVDVTGNTHPDDYSYYLTLETAEPFALGNAPVIATEQNGKIYAYFEVDYSDWYEVRAYAWKGVEGQEGFERFAGDWAGTDMERLKDKNGNNTNVYRWMIDEKEDGRLPEYIIFSYKNGSYNEFKQTGNLEFTNGGYYKISGLVGVAATSNHAYSNLVNVSTHKTKMTAGAYDWTDVEGDNTHDLKIANEFDITVKQSSKSEILGYYAYRWDSSYGPDTDKPYAILDDDCNDISPNGQAGNQGQFYTVAMNTDYTANAIFQGRTVMDVPFIDNYIKDHADEWTYAPVVEVFAPVGAVDANGNDREDYNTYGASLQKLASAKIEVTPSFTATTGTGQDGYEWTMNGSTYVYYNNLLQVNVLDLPQGYQVDKVRAWRKVNATDFLGEQAPNLPNTPDYRHRAVLDKNGEYMFSNYNTSNYDPESRYDIQKDGFIGGEEDANHIMAGTFGGKKLNQGETVTVDFVVRVYFTKTGTGAKDGENKTYYIAETTATGVLNSDIPTSIFGVESAKNVTGVKYYNMMGIESNVPFQGVNIVVTTYDDGTRSTRKIMK